jgi:hypothetical protein
MVAAGAVLSCSPDRPITPLDLVELSQIDIDGSPSVLERGARDTLSAVALDSEGDTIAVPVVWRSSNERVAIFERGGVLVALDTGTTNIRASSVGVESAPVALTVVWLGPAKIDTLPFSPPSARGPGVAFTDSIRAKVTNVAGAPVANVKVAFTVTQGGGSVSPQTATTNAAGIASAQWTTGEAAGINRVSASVVKEDGTPFPFVTNNTAVFTVRTYNALTVVAGNDQTAQIMSDLAVAPSVRLVDSLGNARSGVPVTFTVFANGRVMTPVVSTGADGIASPGTWTLGDISGIQRLEARVENAKTALQATGTGTPIYYQAAAVSAGGFTTCARESTGTVKCWGSVISIGTGDTTNISTPKAVKGTLVAASLVSSAASISHACALTSSGEAWCWGRNALTDTSGSSVSTAEPTRLSSDILWAQISTGQEHNCAITLIGAGYCWGFNSSTTTGDHRGQLGDGTTTNRSVPTPVAGGFTFSRIAAGTAHSCGLVNSEAYCWGQNQSAQLGDGTAQLRLSPTKVIGGLTFETIGAGATFSCGLTPQPEGKAYCWGNVSGVPQTTPTAFPGAPAFVSLSVGGGHACALTADAQAYCWGGNSAGQLGDSSRTTRSVPTRVAGGLLFNQISAGFGHTCGVTTAGAVACWGSNAAGELGESTSTVTSRTTPRHVILGVTP